MRIVVAGASGFVGRPLVEHLRGHGHQVLRLVRDPGQVADAEAALWDPAAGTLDPGLVEGADAVVNLCGQGIGDRRWTARVKRALRISRLEPTALLARIIAGARRPPRVLVNASAVGLYGDRGDEVLAEGSPAGQGFLAELTRDWEAAALTARSERTRVVLVRMAMVVGRGGAVGRMLLPFRLGLGGPVGSGRQWWPWIALEDAARGIGFVLEHPEADGPFNLVSPVEVRCRDFARALGRALGRPALLPLPGLAARLALGEMAGPLLLASARVRPAALLGFGFEHRRAALEDALRAAVG